MCNSFYHRQLLIVSWISITMLPSAFSQQNLYESRSIQLEGIVEEELYHQALFEFNPYRDLSDVFYMERQKVVSLLNTRYPQLTYELEKTPKQALAGGEIANLMIRILQSETAAGVVETENGLWQLAQQSELSQHDKAVFKFLYAYELFKQKRFADADRIFEKILLTRKGEYEYAFFYSGLIDLLNEDYTSAAAKLKKIGKNEMLQLHAPYYLAAAHYGNKDYDTIEKFYSPRLKETNLHNITGLTKIVGYAQFNKEDYEASIATLKTLEQYRKLNSDEQFVLGMAYQKSGNRELSTKLLSKVADQSKPLAGRARYEQAVNLSKEKKYSESIALFEELLTQEGFNRYEVVWNLAVLNGQTKKYDQSVQYATELLDSYKKDQAIGLLEQLIDNVKNERLYVQLIRTLYQKLADDDVLKTSVYGKAMVALKNQDKKKANTYFELLADIDPLVEERGTVAAWRGIMAFEEGNFPKAVRLLTNYQNARPLNHQYNTLDFNSDYFLGYANFKLKNHSGALGHFANTLDALNKNNELTVPNSTETIDDLYLRMGDCYFLLDEYPSAQRAYNYLVQNNRPQKDYALWQTSIIAELQNKPYDQIVILDELINDFTESKYRNRAIFSTANALFAINRFEKSAKFYQHILQSNAPLGLQEESKIQLGLINVNAGNYQQAANLFQELIDSSQNQDVVHRSHIALREIYSDYTYDTDAYLQLIASDHKGEREVDLASELFDLAMNNFEKGNSEEAIRQWKKLIQEYPESPILGASYKNLAVAYESTQQWELAMEAYNEAASHNSKNEQINAFIKAEAIAYDEMNDLREYLEIRKKRRSNFPDQDFTTEEIYRECIANFELGNFKNSEKLMLEIVSDQDFSTRKKKNVIARVSLQLSRSKQWSGLLTIYENPSVENIVDGSPKLVYQRSLALFNEDQLDEAIVSITDHYDTLLEDPAWLAKGIILLSDIYVLKDDKISAEAALEALIGSESKIPEGQIEIAKKRRDALEPQN